MDNAGKVYILGAGPGDYKLMTLKAAACIGKADIIVYDRLVSPKVLEFARVDAERIYVGKEPGCHVATQEEINAILIEKALAGKTVARVKGGDPFVFGRGGEEAQALRAQGIPFEIIPGVTSAIAVPAYAGIPVTHRDFCASLHIITGHERPGKENSALDYGLMARMEGTLVFLMGVKGLPEIAGGLIAGGKDKNTPAAVIEKGTTAEQRVVIGTLEDIAHKVADAGIKSPAITVIGRVVALQEEIDWFPSGPLSGIRVMVTRSRDKASQLVSRIEELGGEALEFPMIQIVEPLSFSSLDEALTEIKTFHWLVFTSPNGVTAFFNRMKSKQMDIRALAGLQIAAVGRATEEVLRDLGLYVDYVPGKYTTGELADGLVDRVKEGERVLLARAEIAGQELTEALIQRNIDFVDTVVYRTVPDIRSKNQILDLILKGKVDFLTFTSASTVQNFMAVIGPETKEGLSRTKVVCIGPITAKAALDAGLFVAATADTHTIEGLVNTLIEMVEV